MKVKDIDKIRIVSNSVIFIYKEGKTERLNRTTSLMQVIDAMIAKGVLKYEQVEFK